MGLYLRASIASASALRLLYKAESRDASSIFWSFFGSIFWSSFIGLNSKSLWRLVGEIVEVVKRVGVRGRSRGCGKGKSRVYKW